MFDYPRVHVRLHEKTAAAQVHHPTALPGLQLLLCILPQLVHGEIWSSPDPGTLPTQQHHIHMELHWTRRPGGVGKNWWEKIRPQCWNCWHCCQQVVSRWRPKLEVLPWTKHESFEDNVNYSCWSWGTCTQPPWPLSAPKARCPSHPFQRSAAATHGMVIMSSTRWWNGFHNTSSTAQGGGGSFRLGNLWERLVVVNHGWQSESTDWPKGGWICVCCNGCSGHLTHNCWM